MTSKLFVVSRITTADMIPKRIPISLNEWRIILHHLTENDVKSWNLLREFHKAKFHTAYVRDVAANLGVKRTDIIDKIDALGLLIAGRNGKFCIVRRLNPRSECWWPVGVLQYAV